MRVSMTPKKVFNNFEAATEYGERLSKFLLNSSVLSKIASEGFYELFRAICIILQHTSLSYDIELLQGHLINIYLHVKSRRSENMFTSFCVSLNINDFLVSNNKSLSYNPSEGF